VARAAGKAERVKCWLFPRRLDQLNPVAERVIDKNAR
jgi:hypothetical protein